MLICHSLQVQLQRLCSNVAGTSHSDERADGALAHPFRRIHDRCGANLHVSAFQVGRLIVASICMFHSRPLLRCLSQNACTCCGTPRRCSGQLPRPRSLTSALRCSSASASIAAAQVITVWQSAGPNGI